MGTALVVGASGFIGANLVENLVSSGYTVLATYRSRPSALLPQWSNEPKVIPLKFDCDNTQHDLTELLTKLLPEMDESAIMFNCLWEGDSSLTSGSLEVQLRNVSRATRLIESAAAAGFKRYLSCGSEMERAIDSGEFLEESEDRENYALSKVATRDFETLLCYIHKVDRIHASFSTPIGRGMSEHSFISQNLHKAMNGEALETPSNEIIQNFIDVRDLAEGLRKAAEKGRNKGHYRLLGPENFDLPSLFSLLSRPKTDWEINSVSHTIIDNDLSRQSVFHELEFIAQRTLLEWFAEERLA